MGSKRLGAGQHSARAKARAKGRAAAGQEGAGRVQGRAQRAGQGCKISILRFSRPENLKNHVFAIWGREERRKGKGGRVGFGVWGKHS